MSIPIGKKIRKARRDADLTQKEVAEKVGFSPQALSAIENGDTEQPDKSNLIALARILKSNFGESWLDEYLSGDVITPSKKEIIQKTPPEEYFSLRIDGQTTVRKKEEALRLRNLANKLLEQMEDNEKKLNN